MTANAGLENPRVRQRLDDIRKFGTHSLAYSTLQPGLREFRHPSFEGYIAYSTVWGIDYVLSDPVTSPDDFIRATLLFLRVSKPVVFCQISKTYAKILNDLGLTVNGLGVEHIVHLDNFQVTWRQRKRLKGHLSSLSRQGFVVYENQGDLDEIRGINEQWLKSKSHGRQLRFMARPFVSLQEPQVRFFGLIKDHKTVGYCTFDPVYSANQNNQVVGYALQHLRVNDRAPSGAQDFLILKAIFQMQEEGLSTVSLGLSPLYQRSHDGYKYSRLAEALFSVFYQMNWLYKYQSLAAHKEQYKVDKNQVYIAVNNGFTLKKLLGFLKVNHLF